MKNDLHIFSIHVYSFSQVLCMKHEKLFQFQSFHSWLLKSFIWPFISIKGHDRFRTNHVSTIPKWTYNNSKKYNLDPYNSFRIDILNKNSYTYVGIRVRKIRTPNQYFHQHFSSWINMASSKTRWCPLVAHFFFYTCMFLRKFPVSNRNAITKPSLFCVFSNLHRWDRRINRSSLLWP